MFSQQVGRRNRPVSPAAQIERLENKALMTTLSVGLATPSGFTAGTQTTSPNESTVKYATLTDGSGNKLTAWYVDSGTHCYAVTQYAGTVAIDDPEPLPDPVPGSPPTPPPPPFPIPILPGVNDTNGSWTSETIDSVTYYYRDSTRGTLTIREFNTASGGSGDIYFMVVTADSAQSSGGN